MATTPPVSVADLRAHLNMDPEATDDDTELALHLVAATEACEGEIGPILRREVTERVTCTGGVVVATFPPLAQVESLAQVGGAAIDPVGLDADRSGVIRAASGRRLPRGRYDITYIAGMAAEDEDVPGAVKLAVMIVAGHMWETQRGRQARGGFVPGEVITPTDQSVLIMSGFSLPRRALELLKPYRLAPAVA